MKIVQRSLLNLLSDTWSWICAFSRDASAEHCSPSVYDKVAACVRSMSTRWNLQMHTYLWPVTVCCIPLPSVPAPHVLLPTRSLRFRVSVSGKNIVSAVCKCLETRHQDIRYRRDLSSWQFRTEHPFRSHRFPPYPLWPLGIHSLCALQLSRSHHIALLNTPSRSRTAAKVAHMINRAFPTSYCLCVYVETLAERLNCASFVPRQLRESASFVCGLAQTR